MTGWSDRFERFFTFFRTQRNLAGHIRELMFVGGSEIMPDGRKSPFVFQYENFLSVLPALVSLRTLRLRGVHVRGDLRLRQASDAGRAPLASLDVLEVQRYAQEPAGLEFLSVLSSMLSFMSVNTLKISGDVPLRNPEPGIEVLCSRFNLYQLAITDVDPVLHDYLHFFECVTNPATLRAVALQCSPVGTGPFQSLCVVRFLSSEMAHGLVSVNLDFFGITSSSMSGLSLRMHVVGSEPVLTRFDIAESTREALGAALRGCTQLMYLRLGLVGWATASSSRRGYECYAPVPQPPMLVPLLSSLPPTFRALSLRLRVRCQEDGDWWSDCVPYWDLEKLDDIFGSAGTGERSPDPKPRSVSVMFDVYPDDEDLRVKTLEEYDAPVLPKLQTAGMLRARVVREPWRSESSPPFVGLSANYVLPRCNESVLLLERLDSGSSLDLAVEHGRRLYRYRAFRQSCVAFPANLTIVPLVLLVVRRCT